MKTLPPPCPPVAIYKSPRAYFAIYRAKDLYRSTWNHPALARLVSMSRKSYERYGKRPRFDKYDSKAAIYLAQAVYSGRGDRGNQEGHIEEWLSIRMVPGDHRPLGVGEPEIYRYAGKPVVYWMKKKIGANRFWNHIVSSSRMCGIHPYAVRRNNHKIIFLKDARHRFTSVCFALIHKQFLLDYPIEKFPYTYITAIIRPDAYKKMLGFPSRGKLLFPGHRPASFFLHAPRRAVLVNRDVYTYQFPRYWLDMKKMISVVNTLRRQAGLKPLLTLDGENLSRLMRKTKRPVILAGVTLTSVEWRELIDRAVPDVPELHLTGAKSWYRGIDAILRAAKIKGNLVTL
jgi:hypothetical protein